MRDVSLEVALAIVRDVARGVHEAHELATSDGAPLGLVHRDVSPGNVLIGLDGAVKLADFGIAKETRVATLSGSMHGTVTYMAPEQCRGHAFDRRADIFSLGVILLRARHRHAAVLGRQRRRVAASRARRQRAAPAQGEAEHRAGARRDHHDGGRARIPKSGSARRASSPMHSSATPRVPARSSPPARSHAAIDDQWGHATRLGLLRRRSSRTADRWRHGRAASDSARRRSSH